MTSHSELTTLARARAVLSAHRQAARKDWMGSTYSKHLYGGWERDDGRLIVEPHVLGMKFHEACKALWCPVCTLCNKGPKDCHCRPPKACWNYLGQIGKDWTDTYPCPNPQHGAIPTRAGLYKSVFSLTGNQAGKTSSMLSEFCAALIGRRPWDDTLTVLPGQNRLFMVGCMSLSKSAITVICPEIELRIGHLIDKQLTSAGGAVSGYRLKAPYLDTISIASQEQVRNAGKDGVNPGEGGRFDYCAWDEPPEKRFRTPVLRGLVRARSRGGGYGREIGAMTPMNSIYVLEEIQGRAWNMGGDEPSIHVVTGTIHDNPSLTEESKRQIMAGWDASEREAREFGHFLHLIGRVFPEVCEAHEYDEELEDPLLVRADDGLSQVPSDAPVMCILDPHGRRRWVCLWISVDKEENAWVVREWPADHRDVAKPIDYGGEGVFVYMAKLIKGVEEGLPGGPERVIWRTMDPNRGRSPAEGSGYDSIVRAMAGAGKELGLKLHFRTDISDNVDEGHAALRNLLAFDASKPRSFDNAPQLRVNSKCRLTLWGLHNYVYDNWSDETKAPKEKPKEIGKDPVDCLRYFAMCRAKWRDWRGRGLSISNQIQLKAARLADG